MAILTIARSRPASAPAFVVVAVGAFILAAFAPYQALLFSPILLGAPHALSDIWYLLVSNSGVSLRVRVALAVLSAAILGTALVALLGVDLGPSVESALLVLLLGVPLALAAPIKKTWPLWLIVGILGAILLATTFPLRAIVAHLHNVIALIFVCTLALPLWRKSGVVLVLLVVASLLSVGMSVSILNNAVFLKPVSNPAWSPFLSLVFGQKGGVAGAILFSYGLMQLLHFAVWIGFIPALKGDLGWGQVAKSFGFGLPLLGAIVIAITIAAAPLAAVHDPVKARSAYLTLVSFHGWMEIAWLLAHSGRLLQDREFSLRRIFLFEASHA